MKSIFITDCTETLFLCVFKNSRYWALKNFIKINEIIKFNSVNYAKEYVNSIGIKNEDSIVFLKTDKIVIQENFKITKNPFWSFISIL